MKPSLKKKRWEQTIQAICDACTYSQRKNFYYKDNNWTYTLRKQLELYYYRKAPLFTQREAIIITRWIVKKLGGVPDFNEDSKLPLAFILAFEALFEPEEENKLMFWKRIKPKTSQQRKRLDYFKESINVSTKKKY